MYVKLIRPSAMKVCPWALRRLGKIIKSQIFTLSTFTIKKWLVEKKKLKILQRCRFVESK